MTTRSVQVKVWTGRAYWRQDDLCRGETPPVMAACRRRDAVLERIGLVNGRGFAAAWKAHDRGRMNRLSTGGAFVDVAMSIDLAKRPLDCQYDGSWVAWYCWVKKRGTDEWTGARSEVVRYERPGLPVWKVVAAGAPDV
jgi:hypothetical protein